MATIYKCDKCGKTIKKDKLDVSINDWGRLISENISNRFEFCESCAKPVASYLRKYI